MTNFWFWILSVLVVGVILARSYAKSRIWTGANFFIAAVLVGWGVSPWSPGSLSDGQVTDVCLIVVDVSESMGPEPSALLSRSFLHLPQSGRLIVVAAGSSPQVCFDGLAESYPDQLRPNQLNESIASRLNCDLATAIDSGLALMATNERAQLQVVSDGGFDLDHVKVLLQRVGTESIVALKVHNWQRGSVENLGIRIIGPSRTFVTGAKLSLEVEVFGHTLSKRSLSLRMSVAELPPQITSIQLQRGFVNRRLLLETASLSASASMIAVTLVDLGPRDQRLADNQDSLAIRAHERPLSLLLLEGESATPVKDSFLAPFVVTGDPQRLNNADVVVIHDLDVREGRVSSSFWTDLRTAVEKGVGLLLVGNQAAFGLGHWDGHLLDKLSPLASKPGNKKRCLIVALDRSGSMENNRRLQRAGLVVEETFARLGPGDRLVLLLFSAQVETFEFAKADPKSRQELHQVLQGARASGGTNLSAVIDAIVDQKIEDSEDGLAFLLTDGRDSQSMTDEKVSRWARVLRAKTLGLHLFWFDRDLALRPLLLQLVGAEDHLVDVDDFGALQKPFFLAMSKDLVATDEEFRLQSGALISFDRVLRTRPQQDAEILASGSDKLIALAKIRRGLGKVAAAPVDLLAAEKLGLWGEGALVGFLQSLARPKTEAVGELQMDLNLGAIRMQLTGWEGAFRPKYLTLGGQKFPLRQIGPKQFSSDTLDEMPKSQLIEVMGQDGTILAQLGLKTPRFVDAGPEADSLGLANLLEFFDSSPPGPKRGSGIHLGLLLLALTLLGAELLVGIRSRG